MFVDEDRPHDHASMMTVAWGKFVFHDMSHTAQSAGTSSQRDDSGASQLGRDPFPVIFNPGEGRVAITKDKDTFAFEQIRSLNKLTRGFDDVLTRKIGHSEISAGKK